MYNLWSEWNYVINVWCHLMNDSILENIWQAKRGKCNGQEDNGCYLVQHYLVAHNQERGLIKCHIQIMDIYGSNLIISRRQWLIFLSNNKNKSFKNDLLKTRNNVSNNKKKSHDGSWRMINKNLTMMNHALEKSKQESWHWGTRCDGEGQVDI
jgi:hypothetical protein